MPDITMTENALWKQAADQVNAVEALNAAEAQIDLSAYALTNLIQDIQAYSGTGKISLSINTVNALNTLKIVGAESLIGDSDVAHPDTSTSVQAAIGFKKFIRGLEYAYFVAKKKLGLA